MEKKIQVVLIPTKNNDSKIGLNLNAVTGRHIYYFEQGARYDEAQHLYFLSDEEIKEGNWKYNVVDKKISKQDGGFSYENDKKVICTTNESLIINPEKLRFGYDSKSFHLPQPSKEFIQQYIDSYNAGNIIEWVDVQYERTLEEQYEYQDVLLIHGKEEFASKVTGASELVINNDNTINILPIKNSWSRNEVVKLLHLFMQSEKPDWHFYSTQKWAENNLK